MASVTAEELKAAHNADLAIQGEENVVFKHAWADPESGLVVLPLGRSFGGRDPAHP